MLAFIESIQKRDPAQPTFLEVFLGYPGFHVLTLFHPLSRLLWRLEMRGLARLWSNIGRLVTGIEIHPQARIGKHLFIDHGTGVVIGQTAVVGDDCTIYQGVTLGGRGNAGHGEKRHPTVGDNVVIGANAQILGPIMVGSGARIGASAVVTSDVEPESTMVGNPARYVGKADTRPASYGLPDGACADLMDEKLRAVELELQTIRQSIK
jgi:serine O-acetyltransferase